MGVMLSLDRQRRPARGRRHGQHARQPGDPAPVQALAAAGRYGTPASGRLLARLTRTVLARRDPGVAAAGAARPAGALADGKTQSGGSAPAA